MGAIIKVSGIELYLGIEKIGEVTHKKYEELDADGQVVRSDRKRAKVIMQTFTDSSRSAKMGNPEAKDFMYDETNPGGMTQEDQVYQQILSDYEVVEDVFEEGQV